jgi:outer membrane protein assembly factor BamB
MRARVTAAIVLVAVLAADPPPSGARQAPAFEPTSTQATGYRVNAQHTGIQTDPLTPPLHLLWKRKFTYPNYALAADGRVFITSKTEGFEASLHALDLRTGRGLWNRALGVAGTLWTAYGAGRVFVLTENGFEAGRVRAFRASDGALAWETSLSDQSHYNRPPTVSGGMVYVSGSGGGAQVYALRTGDGHIVWVRNRLDGTDTSPAVAGRSVVASFGCGQTYALDRRTGKTQWHREGVCGSGDGGDSATVYRGRVYAADPGLIFDLRTGRQVGTYRSDATPTFADGLAFMSVRNRDSLYEHHLEAVRISDGSLAWRFSRSRYMGATIVDGGLLYAEAGGDDGRVFVLQPRTGRLIWKLDPPGRVRDLTAGAGLLLLSTQHALRGYA